MERPPARIKRRFDGRIDLALSGMREATPVVLLGDGKAGFARTKVDTTLGGSEPNYIALADLNADGRLDIITGNYASGDVSVLLAR